MVLSANVGKKIVYSNRHNRIKKYKLTNKSKNRLYNLINAKLYDSYKGGLVISVFK